MTLCVNKDLKYSSKIKKSDFGHDTNNGNTVQRKI